MRTLPTWDEALAAVDSDSADPLAKFIYDQTPDDVEGERIFREQLQQVLYSLSPEADSKRLDALGDYGLCLAAHDAYYEGEWIRTWICNYRDKSLMAPSIREVIDMSVLDIQTEGQLPN